MRTLIAFMKKEITEQKRSGKLIGIAILFVVFGLMNAVNAKITPWLLEVLSETLEQSGMTITAAPVTAMDSWMQFYKNAPMALIVFVLIQSGIFTKEYQTGTLVLALTKGLERYKVVVSKIFTVNLLWTLGYWLYFAVTYLCNAVLWDNSVAKNLAFSSACWWLFGIWVVSLVVLFSVVFKTNIVVLVGTGGVAFAFYLVGLLPKINKFLPTFLTDVTSLIYGITEVKTYVAAVVITALVSIACLVISVPIFNKKQL